MSVELERRVTLPIHEFGVRFMVDSGLCRGVSIGVLRVMLSAGVCKMWLDKDRYMEEMREIVPAGVLEDRALATLEWCMSMWYDTLQTYEILDIPCVYVNVHTVSEMDVTLNVFA